MKKPPLLPLVLSFIIAGPARAEDREWQPYKKLLEKLHLDKFYNVPMNQRDRLKLLLKLTPANKSIDPATVVLTVAHAGGKERLAIDADGMFELVPNQAWINEGAMIWTSMPKGEKVALRPVFAVQPQDGLRWSYASLMASVGQWNALIQSQAGILRFLAPKFNGVEMDFAKPAQQTVRIEAKSGVKTYTADAKGELKLKLDDTLLQENPRIVLSERPNVIGVIPD